jgi:hypothetical protein
MDMDTFFGALPIIVGMVIAFFPSLKLCKRLGLPRGYVFLILVPALGTLIFLYVVAFCIWPIKDAESENRSLAA